MTAAGGGRVERRRLRVAGVVQGVGFRPHVHRLAGELGIGGFVANDAEGVVVEAEGRAPALDSFAARLAGEAPPLASVERIEVLPLLPRGEHGFRILPSVLARRPGEAPALVPPDVAVCEDCLAELFDPADRRYRYPFVNCTNCGPRFTIITALPYDRGRTTMAAFELCARCAAEYADPADRRFHAEPVACPACGPQLWFEEVLPAPGARIEGDAALLRAQLALAAGQIVAIKGIGGYHLACDATAEGAVAELRRRKGRPEKPFAVMAGDLATARRLARLASGEAAALTSPQRPIVLAERRRGAGVAGLVAPGNPRLGVLLPYSPVHHLLFAEVPGGGVAAPRALVMTSGNAGEEPIAYEDGDARRRLSHLADAFLLHDRPIALPCDDSVVLVEEDEVLPVRRSRGYAPLPLRLPVRVPPLLAAGAELKSVACLASGEQAWLSQHLGDMGSVESLAAFERSVDELGELYEVSPRIVVADSHPGYHSRRLAASRAEAAGARLELVQHHHAHVAAVMAEHGLEPGRRTVGVAFDGTGYGADGTVWGGEVLVASYTEAERAAHLAEAPLPGGDAAVRRPYRVALAFLETAGIEWSEDLAPVRAAAEAGELELLRSQLSSGLGCVPTSSAGRLFDAVASIVGVRQLASYEAQAAIELEGAALTELRREAPAERAEARRYRFALVGESIEWAPVLSAVVEDVTAGRRAGAVALAFHRAVAEMIGEVAARLCTATATAEVALSGGVFQNVLLLRLVRRELAARRLSALTHRLVPPNDGGLALGQAVVAGSREAEA